MTVANIVFVACEQSWIEYSNYTTETGGRKNR